MTGIKMARIRFCAKCPHWVNRHANTWRWPKCDARLDDVVELDDEFMGEGDCPLWKDLKPVDLDAEAREQAALQIQFGLAYWKPVLAALAPDAKDALTIRARLTPLVQAGKITPEIAAAVETDVTAIKP